MRSGKSIEGESILIFLIKLLRENKASITLEGLLVFPLILLLLIYFIQISNYSRIQLALISTTSEVTREIALNWAVLNFSESLVPEMLKNHLVNLNGYLSNIKSIDLSVIKNNTNKILLMKLVKHYSESNLDINKIEVVEMKTPNESNDNIYIKLKYKTKIHLPFITKNVEIYASSSERIWK